MGRNFLIAMLALALLHKGMCLAQRPRVRARVKQKAQNGGARLRNHTQVLVLWRHIAPAAQLGAPRTQCEAWRGMPAWHGEHNTASHTYTELYVRV